MAIRVGYNKISITPDYSVPMAGFGNGEKRWSAGNMDVLYAACLAFEDGNHHRMLYYTLDMGNITGSLVEALRAAIHAATGVEEDCIILSCSHSHSAVEHRATQFAEIRRWNQELEVYLVIAARAALADLAETTVKTGKVDVEHMNFVRRYIMNDGTPAGDNYGDKSSGYKCHESEADPQMQVVKFCRRGKRDVLLCNWQAHPHVGSCTYGGKPQYRLLLTDFVGPFREAVEKATGANCIYVQGASGNLNGRSDMPSDNAYNTDCVEYGQRLASFALKAELKPEVTDEIRHKVCAFEAKCNHSQEHKYAHAVEVWDYFQRNGRDDTLKAMLKKYGFDSTHHVSGVIVNHDLPETDIIEQNIFSIGDVAFAAYPYEMFCAQGQYIKENSPYDTTVISGYSNGFFAYLPDRLAWKNGGFEPDITKFEEGTAESSAENMVQLLKELHP